ncbi:type I restriction modification DNA-like protein [Prochlorococcus marinus str. MIT 9312]|uniref:Type I restriction modification DNA-like protein n=2 Tax=Prochlorococcaceae TaxID=2881426 RepID=Q319B4_PROM9|nr:type I restriction modification DNA-like protein [Prochlorococcus marinus str. MIT 9312]
MIKLVKIYFMKKIINNKNNKNEPWFRWLTRELNSYEDFQDFTSGKNPEDVAEDFISKNSNAILEVFENFDEEDKDTLDQFLKLTECEWHVFRILENQIALRDKIRFVDFKNKKKIKS